MGKTHPNHHLPCVCQHKAPLPSSSYIITVFWAYWHDIGAFEIDVNTSQSQTILLLATASRFWLFSFTTQVRTRRNRTFHGSFFFLFNHFLTTPDIQWFKHMARTPQTSLPQPCLSKWDAPMMKDGNPFPFRSGKYTRLKIHRQKIPHEAEKATPQ